MSCLIFLFEAGSKLLYAEQDVGRDVEKDAKPPRRGRHGVAGESILAMHVPRRDRPQQCDIDRKQRIQRMCLDRGDRACQGDRDRIVCVQRLHLAQKIVSRQAAKYQNGCIAELQQSDGDPFRRHNGRMGGSEKGNKVERIRGDRSAMLGRRCRDLMTITPSRGNARSDSDPASLRRGLMFRRPDQQGE